MKILEILEIDKNGRALIHSHSNSELVEAIGELQEFVQKDKLEYKRGWRDRAAQSDLENRTCDGCIHHLSANGNIPLSCMDCSRFYADAFEAKDKFKKCENCKHKDGESGSLTHCSYFEQFMPTEIGKCDIWEQKC